jgi:hypothetical protein
VLLPKLPETGIRGSHSIKMSRFRSVLQKNP